MTYQAVLRFQLGIGPAVQHANMSQNAEIYSVAPARDGYLIDVWFRGVPGEENAVTVPFFVVGTGHPLPPWPEKLHFLGTCVMDDGLVWHVFTGNPS